MTEDTKENLKARIRELEGALRYAVMQVPELMEVPGIANALTPPDSEPVGEVVVTKNEDGDAVAVTRQDEEGEILSVIWERGSEPAEGRGATYPKGIIEQAREQRAAEQQDAMLERREALDDVNRLQAWMLPMYNNVNKHWLDKRFRNIRQSLSRTSDEGGAPEAIRRLPEALRAEASGSFRSDAERVRDAVKREIANRLDRALAEQGGQPDHGESDE